VPVGGWPSGRPHAAPRPAGRPGGAVPPAFHPGFAVQPGAHQPAYRPLCDEPPLGAQRDAARRPPHQHRAGSPQGRLRPDPVRLHRHQPRPAPAAAGRPGADHL
jgi:hypothetical protein